MNTRRVKLLRIGQAHLANNMSLIKWRAILDKYPTLDGKLDSLSDSDLERIIGEIKHVVLFGDRTDPPAPPA